MVLVYASDVCYQCCKNNRGCAGCHRIPRGRNQWLDNTSVRTSTPPSGRAQQIEMPGHRGPCSREAVSYGLKNRTPGVALQIETIITGKLGRLSQTCLERSAAPCFPGLTTARGFRCTPV